MIIRMAIPSGLSMACTAAMILLLLLLLLAVLLLGWLNLHRLHERKQSLS